MSKTAIILAKRVDPKILTLRDRRVILDADLAELYGVPVKRLNQQIKRNARRFPPDFLFRLSRAENEDLRLQFATSNFGHGGRRYLPHAFTEHGAVMAATVLNSKRAIDMSIFVVRAFVRIRETFGMSQQVVTKLADLEHRLDGHGANIQEIVQVIRKLMAPPKANGRRIGFASTSNSRKNHSKTLRVLQPFNRR